MRKLLVIIFFLLPVSAIAQNARIVTAAEAFLATLDADQRAKVSYAFDDNEQRARWSNFPTGVVPRGGINFKQMTDPQRDAAMKLLGIVFSPMGMEKISEIRQADDDFKNNGSKRGPGGGRGGQGGRGPGGPPPNGQNGPPPDGRGGRGGGAGGELFGSSLYYISFLGKPSTTSPWMLQFGGHHLAINVTMSGSANVMTPTLTGAQPASFVSEGKTIRPLGRESDKALALVQSLDDKQKKQAVLNYQVSDLVLGPGQDGKKIIPEGMKVSGMSDKQRTLVMEIIGEWAGIINDASSASRMAQLKADMNETFFAWSGPTDGQAGSNITAYYRIQGPHVVIEYAPQQGDLTNHVHTMYRDPTNDYGSGLLNKK